MIDYVEKEGFEFVDAFIRQSLFSVQALNTFEQTDLKPIIYKIYWDSVQYIASFCKPRLASRIYEFIRNNGLEGNWGIIPGDFAGWDCVPIPSIYKIDQYGRLNFHYSGGEYKYISIPVFSALNDINYIMALKWHFIREISLCQDSVSQFAELIERRYESYIGIYKTISYKENRQLSAGKNI